MENNYFHKQPMDYQTFNRLDEGGCDTNANNHMDCSNMRNCLNHAFVPNYYINWFKF